MSLQSGLYYIGDLCYVLDSRWAEVCGLIIAGNDCLDGEKILSDGTNFAIYSTSYGDGCYFDAEGNEYPVDSGSIGCVPFSAVDKDMQDLEKIKKYGRLVQFDACFRTGATREGEIWFGGVEINTNPSTTYESEYEHEC